MYNVNMFITATNKTQQAKTATCTNTALGGAAIKHMYLALSLSLYIYIYMYI